jgi:hypothetical protein
MTENQEKLKLNGTHQLTVHSDDDINFLGEKNTIKKTSKVC